MFCGICGTVHLEVAGGGSRIVVAIFAVAEREYGAKERYTGDAGVARGQFVGGDETGGRFLLCGGAGYLWDWSFPGNAKPGAGALDGAKTFVRLHGVLPAAAGGPEFLCYEPVAECVWEQVDCRGGGGNFVRGAALAQPGAGALDTGGRNWNGMAVRERAEYFTADGGAGDSGGPGMVGVSAGVASLDEGGTGVLELSRVGRRNVCNREALDFRWERKGKGCLASRSSTGKASQSGFVAANQAVGDKEKQFAIGILHASDERVHTPEEGGPLPRVAPVLPEGRSQGRKR